MTLYQESQLFPLWVGIVILLAAGVLPVALSFIPRIPRGGRWALRSLMIVVPLILYAMVGVMQTTVDRDGVHIAFGAVRLFHYDIAVKSIDSVYARHYDPLSEYNGWGIKRGKSGQSYSMQGSEGVQLVLLEGAERHVLIGSQHPTELAAAIRSIVTGDTQR